MTPFADSWEDHGGGEERTQEYRSWRTKLGVCCVVDIDQVEYRYIKGVHTPVAVFELGTARYGPEPAFLDYDCPRSFPARLAPERPQGHALRRAAYDFDVPAFGICYLEGDLSTFWVWNLEDMLTSWKMTQPQYVGWLRRLPLDPHPEFLRP